MKKVLICLIIIAFVLSLNIIGVGCKEEAAPTEEVSEEVEEAAEEVEEAAEEVEEAAEEEVVAEEEKLIFFAWQSDVSNTFGQEIFAGIKAAEADFANHGRSLHPGDGQMPHRTFC